MSTALRAWGRLISITKVEPSRLKLAIESNVVTDYTKANGMGGIDQARMEKALKQLGENYEFKNEPDLAAIFSSAYLPDDGSLMLK